MDKGRATCLPSPALQLKQVEAGEHMKEIWKDIAGYEGRYQVSNFGNVKSLDYARSKGPRRIKQTYTKDKYLKVDLHKDGHKKTIAVHRLVCEAFVSKVEGRGEVNHINGDKEDNRAKNLEWVTHLENVRHSKMVLKRGGRTPVPVLCVETGHIFSDMHEAARYAGRTPSNIKAAIDGIYQTSAGYHWKRVKDTEAVDIRPK